jgi:sporadic carbohydrate cluster 2OG-Fe(II) oxygenase
MHLSEHFTDAEEDRLAARFLEDGYVVVDAATPDTLVAIREHVITIVCELLEIAVPEDPTGFLDTIHERLAIDGLNNFRIAIYQRMNAHAWFRPGYFALGRRVLEALVGNELAMQSKINFSIQCPNDTSSLLGLHSDSFSGETPFQVVQWIPLVDVYGKKGMYLLKPEFNRVLFPKLKGIAEKGGMGAVFDAVVDDLEWIDVPFGKVLIFSPNLLHGNVVNDTNETRWSMNTRFTGLFTPYASSEKNLGAFYQPITMKPVSRIGLHYQPPAGFTMDGNDDG